MQEVSITVAYDAHVINQINEEDFFASLVANSKPKPVVSLTQMVVLPSLFFYLAERMPSSLIVQAFFFVELVRLILSQAFRSVRNVM